jgi:hypothetical protein
LGTLRNRLVPDKGYKHSWGFDIFVGPLFKKSNFFKLLNQSLSRRLIIHKLPVYRISAGRYFSDKIS